MEQAIESLMFKLDNERRESEYLDDQIKTLESSFASLKASKRFDSPKKNPLQVRLSLLEKQIEYEIAQFDQLKNENAEIRKEVDRIRLENSACKKSLASLRAMIQTSSFKALKLNELKKAEISSMINYQSKISAIRSKSVLHKEECDEKIRNLSSVIRQRSQILVEDRNNERLQDLINNLQGVNIFGVQGVLTKKWKTTVNSKQEEIDNYQKYIDKLSLGFEEIRTAFGIDKMKDIVTTFIKSEQQSHELYKYLSTLNGDIDTLQETLRVNRDNIEKLKSTKGSEKKHLDRLSTVKSRLAAIQHKLEASESLSAKVSSSFVSSVESLKTLATILVHFHPELQEFIENKEFSASEFPKFLKELDRVIENVSTSFSPYRLSGTYGMNSIPQQVAQLLEQKELYDDIDIQESKGPMFSSFFVEKASKLVSNNS